jgi:hypothetical protein
MAVAAPGGVPIVTSVQQATCLKAPPGYSIVTVNGQKVAMLSQVAYALGLKKRPQRGGGITRREVAAARKVQSFVMALTVARKPRLAIKRGGRK